MNRELYLAALRVMARITEGGAFSAGDLSMLRRHIQPGEADLPLDVLCCRIIDRELAGPKASRRPIPPQSQH